MRRNSVRAGQGRQPVWAGIVGVLVVLAASLAGGNELVLKDGRVLRGRIGETAGLAEQPGGNGGDAIKQIVFVNDDFRIIFISRRQIQEARPDASLENAERFNCEQPGTRIGRNNRMKVAAVGPPAGPMKDFDEFGRRTYPMRTAGGTLSVVQVITEITPQYARVEALKQTWDTRVATSTLNDDLLEKLLMHQINPKNVEHRKKVVRFFLQCKALRQGGRGIAKDG